MEKGQQGTHIEGTADCGYYSGCEIGAGDDRHLLVPFFNCLSHRISESWLPIKKNVKWQSKAQNNKYLDAGKSKRSLEREDSRQNPTEKEIRRVGESLEERRQKKTEQLFPALLFHGEGDGFGANNGASVFRQPIIHFPLGKSSILLLFTIYHKNGRTLFWARPIGPIRYKCNWSISTMLEPIGLGPLSKSII